MSITATSIVRIPEKYRGAVTFTFDTDMAHGYSPLDQPGCHGRTARFVADHMRLLMDTAEAFDVNLQWFKIANGLEPGCDWSVYREALGRGHHVDSHTYNHINLAESPAEMLAQDLARSNQLLFDKLGITPLVLRGPGGYRAGTLSPRNRRVILDAGFRFVSGEHNTWHAYRDEPDRAVHDAADHPPYQYDDGLVEIPFHGWTDRTWFDVLLGDERKLDDWRRTQGHQPMPVDWRCPWTPDDALVRFIAFHKASIDYAAEHGLLCDIVVHPYSFYLHDRGNRILPSLLEHVRSKAMPMWVGTMRQVVGELIEPNLDRS